MSLHHQLGLFSEPRARHNDPATSKSAAESLKKNQRVNLARITEIVDNAGPYGCIADEVWQVLCLEDNAYWHNRRSTVHGRVSNAATAGLIVPKGHQHVRLSVLNRIQQIQITPRWQVDALPVSDEQS